MTSEKKSMDDSESKTVQSILKKPPVRKRAVRKDSICKTTTLDTFDQDSLCEQVLNESPAKKSRTITKVIVPAKKISRRRFPDSVKEVRENLSDAKMYILYRIPEYKISTDEFIRTKGEGHELHEIIQILEKNNYSYHIRTHKNTNYKFFGNCDNYRKGSDRFFDILIKFLDTRYGLKVTREDISYTESKSVNGSYHYVIPSYYASCEKLKEIHSNFLNENSGELTYEADDGSKRIKKNVDTTIYEERWFRCPNQSKEGVTGTEHLIIKGTMKDFIFNFIENDSKCIEDLKYIDSSDTVEVMDIIYNKYEEYQKNQSKTKKERHPDKIDEQILPEILFSNHDIITIQKFFNEYKGIKPLKKYIEDEMKLIDYHKNHTELGYIYCLKNEMFKFYSDNFYKLGCTENMISRLNHFSTSYLKKCEVIYISKSIKYFRIAERILFKFLDQYRMERNREFFMCDIEIIKQKMDETVDLIESNEFLEIIGKFHLGVPCSIHMSIFCKHLFFDSKIKLMLEEWQNANISNVNELKIDDDELFDRILNTDQKSFSNQEMTKKIDLETKCRFIGFTEDNSIEKIIEYKDILNSDEEFTHHLNISLLIKNNDYITEKNKKLETYPVNNCRNYLSKIQLIKSLETIMGLNIFKINTRDDISRFEGKVELDELTRENIIHKFRISTNKEQNLNLESFEKWYYQLIQMVKHLCGSELFIMAKNALRNRKGKQKNYYTINKEILKKHMNLYYHRDNNYRNVDQCLLDICDIKKV
ncbi:MAG: hypothetical protein Harvfovirus3_30 [Harvfovirus sp.]|uniref:Bacteriophage T5 Orf172 DNA-binding domain-containing protein n=1 Tax=Harvfovirus sp. TaxID=2487768 RepID=A0A3G5A076_9VIRU|nr:MAG: hypothetical protein Harvfovirus3_30 [Harvfovirus sp.]